MKQIILILSLFMMSSAMNAQTKLADLYFDILDCGKHKALFEIIMQNTSDSTIVKDLQAEGGYANWSKSKKEELACKLIIGASHEINTPYYQKIKAFKETLK